MRESIPEGKSEKCFLSQHTEALCRGGTACWRLDLVMCENPQAGPGFGGRKGLWKAAGACHWERPGEGAGEGAASAAVGGLKDHAERVRCRLHEKAQEGRSVKDQPQLHGRARHVGDSEIVSNCPGQQQVWGGASLSPEHKPCALQRVQLEKWS